MQIEAVRSPLIADDRVSPSPTPSTRLPLVPSATASLSQRVNKLLLKSEPRGKGPDV